MKYSPLVERLKKTEWPFNRDSETAEAEFLIEKLRQGRSRRAANCVL